MPVPSVEWILPNDRAKWHRVDDREERHEGDGRTWGRIENVAIGACRRPLRLARGGETTKLGKRRTPEGATCEQCLRDSAPNEVTEEG
jgi:hypothetical protein